MIRSVNGPKWHWLANLWYCDIFNAENKTYLLIKNGPMASPKMTNQFNKAQKMMSKEYYMYFNYTRILTIFEVNKDKIILFSLCVCHHFILAGLTKLLSRGSDLKKNKKCFISHLIWRIILFYFWNGFSSRMNVQYLFLLSRKNKTLTRDWFQNETTNLSCSIFPRDLFRMRV